MTKKILALILLLLTFSIDAAAYKKASNKFAKESIQIFLTAEGYSSTDYQDATKADGVEIHIFTPVLANSIIIEVSIKDNTIIDGSFNISSANKNGDYVGIRGYGTNSVTGELLYLDLNCNDDCLILTFKKNHDDDKSPIQSPFQSFVVNKNDPSAAVVFSQFMELRTGTLKQLRTNLQQLPYVQKHK